MEHRQAHVWDLNRYAVEEDDMDCDEDKRSEGEIYSDGDNGSFEDNYRREKRYIKNERGGSYGDEHETGGNDLKRSGDENRDQDRSKDSDKSKGSRRDRSRDRRDKDYKYKGKSSRRSPERKRSRSRESSHRHERKSRRHKHKSRHRRHTSSDSRSSSRSGGRSRRRRSRSYDSYGSSDDSRDYYSDHYNERGQDKQNDSYKYQEPNSTVMVRGLASHLTEQDIRADILKCGIMVKDIRLIRHRDTGASRGFAFVEFHSVQEATRWMEMKMGSLVLQDEYHASLIYSVPKLPFSNEKSRVVLSDWYCTKCQGHNFKRREFCYKCHNPRPEDQDPEFTEELSSHPTSTIILYNLDALTTEEGVLQAFKSSSSLASIPIRSVRIARESVTNLSRGMCYVETNNVADAVRLYTFLTQDLLIVDSRQAAVSYSKPTSHSTSSSSVAATALAAAQWTNSGKPKVHDEDTIEKMAQYSASLYAKTPEDHSTYLAYYRDYYRNQPLEGDSTKLGNYQGPDSASLNSHTATVLKASSGSIASAESRVDEKEKKLSAHSSSDAPDTSRYQYDEASGYYYDPLSGFYYDASTQYFYDSVKQQFLYWNAEQSQYVAVPDSNASSSQGSESKKSGDKKKDKDKEKDKKPEKTDKVKVAKKIAKDMEKWAKTLNQKKDGVRPVPVFENSTPPIETPADEPPQFHYRLELSVKPSSAGSSNSSKSQSQQLVAPYGEESDSEEEVLKPMAGPQPPFAPEVLVDFNKMACLLCKRQFPNREVLQKHVKLSDLHKKNLDALKKSNEKERSAFGDSGITYRDRAKERRQKFGLDPEEGKNTLKDMYMQAKKDINLSYTEEPTRDGIKDDNVGNRMLQKMGWQEGQGLGKGNQGRTDLIKADRRAPNVGLGARGVPVIDDDDRYSRARKLTLARYQELE